MIAIGNDHGGYALKQEICSYLDAQKIPYKDFGCNNVNSVDYPDIAKPLAEAVAKGEYTQGILLCGTGIGISIAANKVKGIRAACCSDCY
ncbi:MAG: RpiB/LacA/LacB family sugar-phosphate isomerase, partial [Oscillospiraceae bacterium]